MRIATSLKTCSACIVLCLASTAHAVLFNWIDSGGGNFNDALNWSPAGGPPDDSLDVATFFLNNTYTVQMTSSQVNHSLNVTAGTVTLRQRQNAIPLPFLHDYTLASPSTAINVSSATGASTPAKLVIVGGAAGVNVAELLTSGGSVSYVGFGADQQGVLELDDVTFGAGTTSGGLYVGYSGLGGLGADADTAIVSRSGVLGYSSTGTGVAILQGRWISTNFTAGYRGDAELMLEGNADLTASKFNVAAEPGSNATVEVLGDGTDRAQIDTGTLHVGGGNIIDGASDDDGGNGTLNIDGGEVIVASRVDVGSTAAGSGFAKVYVQNDGLLFIGDGIPDPGQIHIAAANTAELNIYSGGLVDVDQLFAADRPGTTADIRVDAATLAVDDMFYLGGDASSAVGTGTMTVTNGGHVEAHDGVIWDNFDVTVDNHASMLVGDMDIRGSLTVSQSDPPGLPTTKLTALSNTTIDVHGSLTVAGDFTTLDLKELRVPTGGQVTFTGVSRTVDPFGGGSIERLTLEGGIVTTDVYIEFTTTFVGHGTIDGAVRLNNGLIANGDLTIGRPDLAFAVLIPYEGAFTASTHHVTLLQKSFYEMNRSTGLQGGTISVPSGISVRPGLFFSGHGTLDARIFAHGGSVLQADGGDLTLGDPNSLAGFFSDGELYTGANTVTLLDANEAVVGSLTVLGDGAGNPGTLAADNGLLVEFGKNITGHGTIDTPNDPTTPLINNGFIGGNSPAEPITLNGYVKGVGTFGNVVINGTLSPGLSPGEVVVEGGLWLGDAAVIELELAGLAPGVEHDRIKILGDFITNGTLRVKLIDGFDPVWGDTFELFEFESIAGEFDVITLPTLPSGLSFDTSSLTATGVLRVIPEPGGAATVMLGLIWVGAWRRPRIAWRPSREYGLPATRAI